MDPVDRQMTEFLWSLATRAPVFLITILGIVWAVVQWGKAPKGALFTLLACIGLLLASCIFPALFSWFTPFMARTALPEQRLDTIIWTNRAIISAWNVCTAVCLGALIFAVFAGRAAMGREEDRLRRREYYDDRGEPPPPPAPPTEGGTGIQSPR